MSSIVPPNQPAAARPALQTRPPSGSRGSILLVDDDALAGMVLSTWLREKGYAAQLASGPAEADRLLAAGTFDLLLSDIRMPGNFHLEWVERLLHARTTPPILLITGTPDLETALRAANLPVEGCLLKPVDFAALDGVVQRILQKFRRRREFIDVARDIAQLLAARGLAGTSEETTLVERLGRLSASLQPPNGRAAAGPSADEIWRAAITDAITVLEKTKDSFRSKELGGLRQRLQKMLAGGPGS